VDSPPFAFHFVCLYAISIRFLIIIIVIIVSVPNFLHQPLNLLFDVLVLSLKRVSVQCSFSLIALWILSASSSVSTPASRYKPWTLHKALLTIFFLFNLNVFFQLFDSGTNGVIPNLAFDESEQLWNGRGIQFDTLKFIPLLVYDEKLVLLLCQHTETLAISLPLDSVPRSLRLYVMRSACFQPSAERHPRPSSQSTRHQGHIETCYSRR